MKRKILATVCSLALIGAAFTGCSSGSSSATPTAASNAPVSSEATSAAASSAGGAAASGDMKIALITMDQIDQYWVKLNAGAQAEAKSKNVKCDFLSPDTKDDSKQIECINNAVANGYKAIMIAANGPDAVSSALKDAQSKGIKIVYVDSPANVQAVATFSTNNEAAGKTAGEEMLKALKAKNIAKGDIGVINVNAATQSCVSREKGFRSAFSGSAFKILDTQYCDGDASKAQSIAENYITQGVVGIFGCNEGSATGAGNAIKAAKNGNVIGVGFDNSDSIKNLVKDGFLLCTMSQNPDVMGAKGVDACIDALNGKDLGGAVTDTGVTVLNKDNIASAK